MPVKVWTGLPGAGKTAAMVAAILEFKTQHPQRPVYAININGLSESVATPLELDELQRWWELPPESLICIDEAQEDDYFPLDHGKPKEWVKRISKVRHEGMDFWFTTQHPALMSAYVRRLIDQHIHCVRKFNTNVVSRYQWGRCMDAPEKGAAQKSGIESLGTLPAHVFEMYKSSNAHNMKRRIPRKVYFFGALVALAVAAVVAVPVLVKRAQTHNIESIRDAAGVEAQPGVSSSGARVDASEMMRQQDFAKWMKPRIDGLPWSAPMFDQLQVTAKPRLFCVAVEDGRCSCMTEQGTKYAVPLARCRSMVREGVYNPFVDASPVGQERQTVGRASDQPQARSRGDWLPSSGVSGAFDKPRVTAHAYVPPQALPWNADPFGGAK